MQTKATNFLEIFTTYTPDEHLKTLLGDVEVTKISRSSNWDRMVISYNSPRYIEFETEKQIVDGLVKALSPWKRIDISMRGHFQLSRQFNARVFFDMYKDSVEEELKYTSRRLYFLYRYSKVNFVTDDVMMINMPDNLLVERDEELIGFFDELFNERCGLDAEIRKEFYEPDEKLRERMEQKKAQAESEAREMARQAAMAARKEQPTQEQRPAEQASGRSKGSRVSRRTAPVDPSLIYGKPFDYDEITPLSELEEGDRAVVVRGQIFAQDKRLTRKEDKYIVSLSLTDFNDSIRVKMFVDVDSADEALGRLDSGAFVVIKGTPQYDTYDKELVLGRVIGARETTDFRTQRMDNAPEKRVELHCHTKMSDMDGVSDVKDIIKCAKKWGHEAIAITDHGVVQAFPDAASAAGDDPDFKVIYGCEGYLVDDLKDIAVGAKDEDLNSEFVVFDIETTGFSPINNRIIEIGAVKISDGKIVDRFSTFVNPEVPIPYEIEELTSINDATVIDAPVIEDVLPDFMEFCAGCVLVAHNAEFDTSFIRENCRRQGLDYDYAALDTLALSRAMLPNLKRFKLHQVAKELKVDLAHHHRAVDDAECTAGIFIALKERLEKQGVNTLAEVNEFGHSSVDAVRKQKSYHIILLAKNDIGRINLYRLVSKAHLTYFNRRPLIPKSLLTELREGIIIGSACEAGELYSAILRGESDDVISGIANYYDYLEIQPIGNNEHLIADGRVADRRELQNINKKICNLADVLGKPCVATCDVHFLNPEDEVYRRILMAGMKFSDADQQAPLFLRTTEEMLAEFQYLGEDKAYEVVVTNSRLIARMCERIEPVRPDKCPPVIDNSDEELRRICYEKAQSMYGDPLPEVVQKRLERELTSIISNGYAVMYIIAQKLVWKSNDDGYLVGSRGSVGSSFVATMAGITEVNPLSPHYYCDSCYYSDFDSDEVKAYAGGAGCDMPDKVCPVCGKPLKKDGFDIPFETFLGFKGNKEPDIDLNFSGEYQAHAHKYTEVLFGKGQTFKAGTIGTLADKTAYGYVKNYYEERGIPKRKCEIERIIQGCVGVRRTTGQHPGGIVVLPKGEDICSFTPIQHPANDLEVDIITTHFDYHKIEHNLLKLDILGHDDPTMIRRLEDLTGVNAQEIPLDDKGVMSLFESPAALGVTADDLMGVSKGTLGVPEFGTDNVIGMLEDTHPKSFSDLVRISGLSHGTDVWRGNAQTLIENGDATISTAICTRDDIMTYLIGKGLDNEMSFKIMEAVRKGKVAGGKEKNWENYKKEMEGHDVPEWYIWSCSKIQYMFPKAHAAAYVMMAWRIAWFKINYPLEYYAAYLAIRSKNFDYEKMAQGKEKLKHEIEEIDNFVRDNPRGKDALTPAQKSLRDDMRNVWEMYARGYEFTPIDIYKAKAHDFQIVDGKLMSSLDKIAGLGPAAAEAVEAAAKEGPFLSREDFKDRTKVSAKVIELMTKLHILNDIPETNQLSIFDFMGSNGSGED
ncbi:MAG: PolC-type DNA polymerase III [Eubacterium sp.]|nr:PolC-type DNA polymerase III [Eubacterium sp.]